MSSKSQKISRRIFFKVGGATLAGAALPLTGSGSNALFKNQEENIKIKNYRTLGRTEFKVSDISLGCGGLKEPNIVRYVYDLGINYFDTAESYGRGESEKNIGLAQQFMARNKIFITTKLHINEDDTRDSILERFTKCQERLKTEYIDGLYMHSVKTVEGLDNEHFHGTVQQLKQEGRLKHAGVSSHGPRRDDQDSMEKVLCAAAADGRFDLMLLVYNFMNREAGDKILAVCKKHNVGTTAMKVAPGVLKASVFDRDNLTGDDENYIKRMSGRGISKEDALIRLEKFHKEQKEEEIKTKPFAEKYGIKNDDQLKKASIQWVLNNSDMHTVCVAMREFDTIDKIVPLSGTKLSHSQREFINEYGTIYNNRYCRHGCNICQSQCPENVPVSSVMRYAYYYEQQGREKLAMQKYKNLAGRDGSVCETCDHQCAGACPHKINIQANLVKAHSMLSLS